MVGSTNNFIEDFLSRDIPGLSCTIEEFKDGSIKVTNNLGGNEWWGINTELNVSATTEHLEITKFNVRNLRDKRLQNLGVGKLLLTNVMKLAEGLGIKDVSLDAIDRGSYFWARAGFHTDDYLWPAKSRDILENLENMKIPKREMKELKDFLKGSKDPRDIWLIADSKYGKEALHDVIYKAHLDLQDSEDMLRFRSYTHITKEVKSSITNMLDEIANSGRIR